MGARGHGEELVVARTLLRLGEDAKFHGGRRYSHVFCARLAPTARGYAARVLSVDRWPELNEPLLVAALSGWVDAGGAGAGAIGVLAEQLGSMELFATIDVAAVADLQQTRPVARWHGDARVIEWPRITFECNRPITVNDMLGNPLSFARSLLRYVVFRKGLFATSTLTALLVVVALAVVIVLPPLCYLLWLTQTEKWSRA